jgi:hypothetical protein
VGKGALQHFLITHPVPKTLTSLYIPFVDFLGFLSHPLHCPITNVFDSHVVILPWCPFDRLQAGERTVRRHATLAGFLEQVCSPFLLTIVGIFNFDPVSTVRMILIRAIRLLRHDAFQVQLTGQPIEYLPSPHRMVDIQDMR